MKAPKPDQATEMETTFFNIHTHVFTKDHVPEYLAKKFIIWPFYVLLSTDWAIKAISWVRGLKGNSFTYRARNKRWLVYRLRMFFVRNPLFGAFYTTLKWVASFTFIYYLLRWIYPLFSTTTFGKWLYPLLDEYLGFMPVVELAWNQFLLLVALALVFGHLRILLGKLVKNRLKKWVGKERLELLLGSTLPS